jgi:hypothetical protein
MGICLSIGETWEPVKAVTSHTAPSLGIRLVHVDPHGEVERLVPGPHQVVVELLDAGLV